MTSGEPYHVNSRQQDRFPQQQKPCVTRAEPGAQGGKNPYIAGMSKAPAKPSAKSAAAKPAPTVKANAPAPKPAASPATKTGDHVFLVDGSSYIFRAYHALPPLNRKSDGLQVNAVLGFCNMLWKLLRDMPPGDKPTHLAIIFDKSEVTFRNELYPDYKAHRPPAPDDLIPQFALIREAVKAFDLPCLEQSGFEADDLIATYVREAVERGATATIVSSDKDLMQLVTDRVTMYDTMKDRRIGIPEVIEKFGVPPDKVVEVQALAGELDRQRAGRARHRRQDRGATASPNMATSKRCWRAPARSSSRSGARRCSRMPRRRASRASWCSSTIT